MNDKAVVGRIEKESPGLVESELAQVKGAIIGMMRVCRYNAIACSTTCQVGRPESAWCWDDGVLDGVLDGVVNEGGVSFRRGAVDEALSNSKEIKCRVS